MQVLGAGLRTSQTIAELNLSGCKISDEGVQVLAGIIKVPVADNTSLLQQFLTCYSSRSMLSVGTPQSQMLLACTWFWHIMLSFQDSQ